MKVFSSSRLETDGWACDAKRGDTVSCPQLYLVPVGTGINQSVQIDGFTGTTSTPIGTVNCASVVCTNLIGDYDLSITSLTVTGLNGTKIDGASAAVNGTATPATSANDADVGGTESLFGVSGCAVGLTAYIGSPSSCSFCPDHHVVAGTRTWA